VWNIFKSEQKKMQLNAQNWLQLANKVVHFRRDQLSNKELEALQKSIKDLRSDVREKADASNLKLSIGHLEDSLQKSGGTFYPKSGLVEWVEFLLVASILFIGIRTFFIQPFKIPTNSMWPSYYGMTAEVFTSLEEEPNSLERVFRLAAYGAKKHSINAPASGELEIPFRIEGNNMQLAYSTVRTRRWFILRATGHEYTFYVGGEPVTITVPADFRIDQVLSDIWFGEEGTLVDNLLPKISARSFSEHYMTLQFGNGRGSVRTTRVSTGKTFQKGERLLSFDILTGDQLFVDRMSYHFSEPKVGQGFVFRTRNIKGVEREGKYTDKYYIKRLVGVPGDTLEVKEPALYRNGKEIEGSAAFGKNAQREGLYRGYVNIERLDAGKTVTIPEDSFFAMGDNSSDSLDSRYWGTVPGKDVIGKPLFIYYPFTRRWGPAL
jgi:signal peptidase I